MPVVSGERLDKVAERLHEWFVGTRLSLIKKLEVSGYPFGNVPLSPREQLTRYINMTPEQWTAFYGHLYLRYKGMPDAPNRVMNDIRQFQGEMEKIRSEVGSV